MARQAMVNKMINLPNEKPQAGAEKIVAAEDIKAGSSIEVRDGMAYNSDGGDAKPPIDNDGEDKGVQP